MAVQRTVEVLQVDDAWLLIRGDLNVDDRIVAVMPKRLRTINRSVIQTSRSGVKRLG